MLPHQYLPKGYDLSIYIDADMLIKRPLTELLEDLNKETLLAACRHGYCASVREEINDLINKGMVNVHQVEQQWQRYVNIRQNKWIDVIAENGAYPPNQNG